jgi:carboxylesterase
VPVGPIDLEGRTPLVLLFHGFAGTPWELQPVANALHGAGFAVHAPLLPGHGVSPEDLSRTGWHHWSAFVREHTERALARHGRILIVGMSLGGLLAIDATVALQHRGVVGVVTLGCALRLSTTATGFLTLAQALGDRMPDAYLRKNGSDVRDPAVRHANPGYSTNPLRAAREILHGQRAVRACLPALRVPLLALHGAKDGTAPLQASLELVDRAGSVDKVLIVLPRSGHLIAVDHDRDEVQRQVVRFATRLAGNNSAGSSTKNALST